MTRYALVIGIQKYGRSGFGNLEKSVEDAEAIAKILETHGGFVKVTRLPCYWNEEKQCDEVIETDLNHDALDKALVEFFDEVGSNEALIYFSGHGYQVTKLGKKKGYLVTSNCTTANVATEGIALEDLNTLICNAASSNKAFSSLVVLLDCCHSGSLLEQSQVSSALSTFTSGGRNYFLATACRSHEKAYEGKKHSLFTDAVIKALNSPGKDGSVRTGQLHQVINEELRGSGQEPVILSSGGEITLVTHPVGRIIIDPPDKLQDALGKLAPDYEILDKAFFDAVAEKVANNQARAQILTLRAANWSMLFQKTYIERDQQGEALEKALRLSEDRGISLMLIRGEPGAGKTALLRWLAYELFCQGEQIFYRKRQGYWLKQLRKFSEESGGKHFYVIADDLFRDESIFEELQQNEFLFPLTLIGTTRQNEDQHYDLPGLGYKTVCLDLAKPSTEEKERILALPEVQSHLEGKSATERRQLMESPIMLVLMLQLSEGKPFDMVLQDIVKNLPQTDQKPLYKAFGVLCSFFQYGITVPLEILRFCLPDSNCSERLILSGLEGLIDKVNYGGYEGFIPIHELIAKKVMELDYRPDKQQNQPYAWVDRPCLLERHLKSILSNIDVDQETQKRWIHYNFRILVVNGESDLVRRILQDYSLKIETIQQQNTISSWSNWLQVYTDLGWVDEQQRCICAILAAKPQIPWEWVFWLSTIEKRGIREQQQEAIVQTKTWLDNHSDDWLVRVQYLTLIRQVGDLEQKQKAIFQTETWLDNHPDDLKVREQYLSLVEQLGSQKQKQEAIDQTKTWLDDHSDDWHIRERYLVLIEQRGSREQQQEAIVQTKIWLDNHPDDLGVRERYLTLVERLGSQEQQQEAIVQTKTWLDNHPDNQNVCINYLVLVEQRGSREQQQEVIVQTKTWLDNHPDNLGVREKYLTLVERLSSQEQQQEVIIQTKTWLDNHPNDWHVRRAYLLLIGKIDNERIDKELLIHDQWQWIVKQKQRKLEQSLWSAFLPVLYHHGSPELYQPATQLVLEQYPDDFTVVAQVFGYFRNYLDYSTCHKLATWISRSRLPKDKWQNYIHAANFFRDHHEFDIAEDIYYQTIGRATNLVKKFPTQPILQALQKTIDFANLHYAQLLLLTNPPDPSQALTKLRPILTKNLKHGYAHLLMAQSYKAKGASFHSQATTHFQKAIQFDKEKQGFFYYQFGCFYRYSANKNPTAQYCFRESLKQKINLPASIELAELEATAGNLDQARTLLQNGLALIPITLPEKEEREKLEERINALELLLGC